MKEKTQFLPIAIHSPSESSSPFYCPFTGVKLLDEDVFQENSELNYPNTVCATWAGDQIQFDSPHYWREEFSFLPESFENVEDVVEFMEEFDKLEENGNFILIELKYYGSLPMDFGNFIFLLKIPQ